MLSNNSYRSPNVTQAIRDKFTRYTQCMRFLRQRVDTRCTPLLLASCDSRQLRAAKTVRATMASMEPLLKNLPNSRVIHLIRDPRGVVLSRYKVGRIFMGRYSVRGVSRIDEVLRRESQLYCRTVVNDVKIRRRLEKLYPGRIYTLVYDDVVRSLQKTLKNVYFFLNTTSPKNITEWSIDQSSVGSSWTTTLTSQQNTDILSMCREFFDLVQGNWMSLDTRRQSSMVMRPYNVLRHITRKRN